MAVELGILVNQSAGLDRQRINLGRSRGDDVRWAAASFVSAVAAHDIRSAAVRRRYPHRQCTVGARVRTTRSSGHERSGRRGRPEVAGPVPTRQFRRAAIWPWIGRQRSAVLQRDLIVRQESEQDRGLRRGRPVPVPEHAHHRPVSAGWQRLLPRNQSLAVSRLFSTRSGS